METVLTNAQVVTPDDVFLGTVVTNGETIARIDRGKSAVATAQDLEGDYVIPGLVDIHTDLLERHIRPRPKVPWNEVSAAISHDGHMATAGVTTVLDALGVGISVGHSQRNDTLAPMIEGLRSATAAKMLRSDHLLHLRCEITDDRMMELFETFVDDPLVTFISVMDHTPGRGVFKSTDEFREYISRKDPAMTNDEVDRMAGHLLHASEKYGAERRAKLVETGRQIGIPMASHDDCTVADVQLAADQGMIMSEFPTTMEAAVEARKQGLMITAGAPNLVRGGSHHAGNLSTGDLARNGLLDVLASDYVPGSMIEAVFILAGKMFEYSLPEAVNVVSRNPATAARLDDRGEISVGKRADMVQVKIVETVPIVRRVWRGARRVS